MGIIDNKEVDFPRGGAVLQKSTLTVGDNASSTGKGYKQKTTKRKADEDTLFGDGKKPKKASKVAVGQAQKKKKDEEAVAIWKKPVTADMLTDGVMGLGVVREIAEDQVLLETSDSCRVNLPATQVGKTFTDLLKQEKISLEDVFTVGQMVPFKVTKRMVDNGKKGKVYPVVSCEPSKLNSHLTSARLVPGLVIHSIVESMEEKGCVLDVGLQSVKGFLPKDKQPSKALILGQPLVVRIETHTSRIVKVSAFVEQDNLAPDACEKLHLNHLMPGTIVECTPGEEEPVAGGVYVTLGNGVRAFIARRHLPPRLRADTSRLARAIRAVVMFCQQNTNLLVLSAHPDIVAVAKPEKRTNFQGHEIGDKLVCTVIDVIASKSIVCFSLPMGDDGKVPLITAVSVNAYLHKADECAAFYKIGSEHECRIIDVRLAERNLVVATRKDILKQKIVSYKDAAPGDLVDARVTRVHSKGVQLSICGMVKGFMPIDQASDKATAIEKSFPVGREFKCRVLYTDEERKQVTVTARESMLHAKGARIVSYDESWVGQAGVGVVVNVLPTGGLLVLFYNSVKGLIPATEAKRAGGNIKKNQSVEVRVMSVDVSNSRMSLAFADESLKSSSGVQKPEPVSFTSPGAHLFSAVVNEVVEMGVAGRKHEKAELNVELKGKPSVRASLTPQLASDALDAPFESFSNVLAKNAKIDRIAPLGFISGVERVTSKRFICDWLTNPSHVIPKSFDDLNDNQIVCGVVSQRLENGGLFIELAGGSGLVGRAATQKGLPENETGLQLGQTVLGRVGGINQEKKTFNLSVKLSHCFPADEDVSIVPISLVKSFVNELLWFAKNSTSGPLPAPGTVVSATVSHIVDEMLFVTFDNKLTGCVKKGNYKEGVQVGDKIDCLVVDYTFPRNDAELVQIEKSKTQKKKSTTLPRVVLIKRDYVVVLDGKSLYFVPNRLHPNVVPATKTARVALGDSVSLVRRETIAGSLQIALLDGDIEILKELATEKTVNAAGKGKTFPQTGSSLRKAAELETNDDNSEEGHALNKTKLGIRTFSLKNFKIYTGTVEGEWEGNDVGRLSAKLKLPGDNIGRLHVSELPTSNLKANTDILSEFIAKNRNKTVNVKVIGYSSVTLGDNKKVRIAEVTMNEHKLMETRLKARVLSYKMKFNIGDTVNCFALPNEGATSANLKVEISPIATGIIPRENLSDDLLVKSGTDTVADFALSPCELRSAVVTSVSRGGGRFQLTLQLRQAEEGKSSTEGFALGQPVTGRVTNVNPANLTVNVQLGGGHQAILTPTAISAKYEKVQQHLAKFSKGEIFHLIALRRDEEPRRYYVVTEGRYDNYVKQCKSEKEDMGPTALIPDIAAMKQLVGKTMHGFVSSQVADATFVELAPGLRGRLRKTAKSAFASCPLNTVVSVKISKVDEENRIALAFKEIVFTPTIEVKSARKRTASQSEAEAIVQKTKKIEEVIDSGAKKVVEVSDPGFDWSNTGFLPEELAAVGKLGEEVTTSIGDEKEGVVEKKDKKTKAESRKKLTKAERDLEKERELVARETELSGEVEPETDEDFTRELRRDPNSAEMWIRYISFFLKKSDLTKARAAAERALETINYREEAELLNVWTAYLNLEVAYGDSATTKAVFTRACGNADSLKVHKQMAAIFASNKKIKEADEIFDVMIRKFRASSDDVWVLYAEHLMSTERAEKGRDLLTRALASVPKTRHTQLITRFAQLEYRKGDAERGKTLFESLVTAYPKKTDIWIVYSDLALKYSGIETARQVLERACGLQLSMHKLRPLFKKWSEAEEKYGDEQSQQLVRAKAQRFLEQSNEKE